MSKFPPAYSPLPNNDFPEPRSQWVLVPVPEGVAPPDESVPIDTKDLIDATLNALGKATSGDMTRWSEHAIRAYQEKALRRIEFLGRVIDTMG